MRTCRTISGNVARRAGALAAGLLLTLSAALVSGSPAYATDTTFNVSFVHSGGAGAVGAATKGSIRWLSRSVALDNVQIYCGTDHNVKATFIAFQNNTQIGDPLSITLGCAGFAGGWTNVGSLLLDGSNVSGGINRVFAQAIDVTHNGVAEQRRNR